MTSRSKAVAIGTLTVAEVARIVGEMTGTPVRTVMVDEASPEASDVPGFVVFQDEQGRAVHLSVMHGLDDEDLLGLDDVTVLTASRGRAASAALEAVLADRGGVLLPDDGEDGFDPFGPPVGADAEVTLALELVEALGPGAAAPLVRALRDPDRSDAVAQAVERFVAARDVPRPQ